MSNKPTIGIAVALILIIALITSVVALTYFNVNVPYSGNIIASANLSVNPTSFPFQNLDAGSTYKYNVVITNIGNTPLTLTMTTVGVPSYITWNWNCTNHILPLGGSVNAQFTLVANSNSPSGNFGFNVTITGTAT
jgi:uncharacterized membrane protein